MILLDPPAWPAHGTLWSHLVSDTSLRELRLFAQAAGLPDRGFDLDHYDAPAARHDELVTAGATPVDGRTLARRLATSGLRVPGHERGGAKRDALAARWGALLPGADSAPVGSDLVARWGEPHRVYHGRLHLAATLDALDALLDGADVGPSEALTTRLAVWFHDAVHDGGRDDDAQPVDPSARPGPAGADDADPVGSDEERSAQLAVDALTPLVATTPLTTDDVAEVARLVRLTAAHDPAPDDLLGGLVSDADLAVLGGSPARYARYVQQVRAEYGYVSDDAFRTGRAAVLDQLLALPTLYATPAGRARWAASAAANLRGELASLRT